VVALFNRSKECVHIDKHDCTRPDYGAVMAGSDVSCARQAGDRRHGRFPRKTVIRASPGTGGQIL
jgi:hypothetical protein